MRDGGTGKTPQGVARGGSRSPCGKRSLVRKSTAVWNRLLNYELFGGLGRSPWRLPGVGKCKPKD
nr:hypothetical protein [Sutcliffiella horikoshii]